MTLCGHEGATQSPGLLQENLQVASQSHPDSSYRSHLLTSLGNATSISLNPYDLHGLQILGKLT